jgi:hypothetical protein
MLVIKYHDPRDPEPNNFSVARQTHGNVDLTSSLSAYGGAVTELLDAMILLAGCEVHSLWAEVASLRPVMVMRSKEVVRAIRRIEAVVSGRCLR